MTDYQGHPMHDPDYGKRKVHDVATPEVRDRFAEQKDAEALAAAQQHIQENSAKALQSFTKADLIQMVKDQRGQIQDIQVQFAQMRAELGEHREFGAQQAKRAQKAEDEAAERGAMVETLKGNLAQADEVNASIGEHADKLHAAKRGLEAQLDVCQDRVEALLDALVLTRKAGQ